MAKKPFTPPASGPDQVLPENIPENNDVIMDAPQSFDDMDDDGIIREVKEPIQASNEIPLPLSRRPDPRVMKMDPMAEMFGPGSTLRQLGDPDDEMPDEVRALIEENGLAKRDFSCVLKEVPPGSLSDGQDGSAHSVYIKGWKRTIPTPEYIAREHGPGSYLLVLSWRARNEEGSAVIPKREMVPIVISEKCATEYKKHQLNKKINDAADTGTKVRDAIVEKTIEGQLISAITGKDGDDGKKQTPKEYIEEVMNTVKMLGLPVGGFGTPMTQKIEWDKILPALIPLATAALGYMQSTSQRRAEEQTKMFMLMMSQNQNASTQVIDMYKTLALKPPSENPLKELQTLVMSALDIKEMLNPPKETLSDKIFRVVEMVAPQILTIATQAAQTHQPPQGPAVDIAKIYVKGNPDFEKLKNNAEEMAKFVSKLDARIGWENADVILQVVEWQRPQSCPRDPSRRYPPQETAVDAEIEDVETSGETSVPTPQAPQNS